MQNLQPLVPNRELDSMLKNNATRDIHRIREYIRRERNDLYRKELSEILFAAWGLATEFDGCTKLDMAKPEFRQKAIRVYQLISKQERGGRKLFVSFMTCPTRGLDTHWIVIWPTIQGCGQSSLKQMKSFLTSFANDALLDDSSVSDMNISESPIALPRGLPKPSSKLSTASEISAFLKARLVEDVTNIVLTQSESLPPLDGFGLGYAGLVGNVLKLEVTFHYDRYKRKESVTDTKEEPKPVLIAQNVPKSEAARQQIQRERDSDGFDISSDSDNNFQNMVARMSPKRE